MKNITLLLIAFCFTPYAFGQTTPEVNKKISSEVEQVARKMEIAEAFTVIDQIDNQTIENNDVTYKLNQLANEAFLNKEANEDACKRFDDKGNEI